MIILLNFDRFYFCLACCYAGEFLFATFLGASCLTELTPERSVIIDRTKLKNLILFSG